MKRGTRRQARQGALAAGPTIAQARSSNSNQDRVRDLIVETVERRAKHTELDDVTDTLSNWSAERIVTGEYHGRFLIELLQNARDALRKVSPDARDGVVRIRLTTEPALVVCNDGELLEPDVLLHAIGSTGERREDDGERLAASAFRGCSGRPCRRSTT